MGLVLRAMDVASPWRWRWLLSDAETGTPLASHPVSLDPASEQVAAFRNLYEYARWRAAPDRRGSDQIRIVAEAGAWAGRELLGEDIGAVIVAEAPAWVRVSVPAPADQVMMWPLELAHATGRPLAARGDVSLIYDIVPGAAARRKEPVGETLRVLAAFSQPTRTSMLALRQERYALSRLMRQIAAREGAAVELQVVQYGVTRERFAQIADSGNGWDVLHLAGHGGPGQFLLEHADGSPDLLEVADLIDLLRPTRHRLKLAMVSACESATETVTETLRLVGLSDEAPLAAEPVASQTATEVTGVARALVRDLQCAVIAMRYPVTDEFAIALGTEFYEHLLVRKHPVDVAAARAVAQAAGAGRTSVRRALSLATPGLFGTRSAGLVIEVPRGQPRLDPAAQKMAHFPDEPERFVGRTQVMTTASAVLAPRSGKTTVLLHGMAGSGKTACAVELAYRHQDAFAAAAFWQAPTWRDEWDGALADFASRLDTQLRDYQFSMAAHIGTEAALRAFLPRLRHVMRNGGLLLVLDNLETLVTPGGSWLDPRWELLIGALTSHGGESRLIMTSQIPPAGLGAEDAKLPVYALSLDESAALARELPHLRALLHADEEPEASDGPVREAAAVPSADTDADRERLRRVLRVVQGHPKLLEFADAAAADRERLDAQLDAAERAVSGERLEAFFRDGASTLDPGQFLAALTAWTVTAVAVLPSEARLMAEFLVCLEDDDRQADIIGWNWEHLWRRLNRAGAPPAPEPVLGTLSGAALVQPDLVAGTDNARRPVAVTVYRLHPGVAAAVRAMAPMEVREAADAQLAEYWNVVSANAHLKDAGEDSTIVRRAGLAAAPYLLRRHDWGAASVMLENAAMRDSSPAAVQAVLPGLRQIAAATGSAKDRAILGRSVARVDPAEAERLLRDSLAQASQDGDYVLASGITGELTVLLRTTGRLLEALDAAGQAADHARRAGLGPWTQLGIQGRRLQVLGAMREHRQVLTEVNTLRARMRELLAAAQENDVVETSVPWSVREMILDLGGPSALALSEFQQVLDLNAETLASMRDRGASSHLMTQTLLKDAGPLMSLGRLAEANQLLLSCQQVFEEYADIGQLSVVMNARARLEGQLGHYATAADFARTALRMSYADLFQPGVIATGHQLLATALVRSAADPAAQRAHGLAACLLEELLGHGEEAAASMAMLAVVWQADAGAPLPATLAEVVQVAEQTEGVRLGELLPLVEPNAAVTEAALAKMVRVATLAADGDGDGEAKRAMRRWEPFISQFVTGCRAGSHVPIEVHAFLESTAAAGPAWAPLTQALRRVLAGERGETVLDGLDPLQAAVTGEVLARLAEAEYPERGAEGAENG